MSESNYSIDKIKSLINQLDNCSDEEYRFICGELSNTIHIDEDYDLLREELKSDNFRHRMAACFVLGEAFDEKSYEAIAFLLKDSIPEIREAAITALSQLGMKGTSSPIAGLVNDESVNVRRSAIHALAKLNCDMLEVILIRCIANDASTEIRRLALRYLRKCASSKSGNIALRSLIEDDFEIRNYGEQILDRIIPYFSDANYILINEGLTLRERRLIISYLEQRSIHVVFPRLFESLHSSAFEIPKGLSQSQIKDAEQLTKYGKVLYSEEDLMNLQTAYQRDEIVDLITDNYLRGIGEPIILVGESGSGKTAIAQTVMHRLLSLNFTQVQENSGNVKDKWVVIETSTAEMMTDTRYLGEWETKLKQLLQHIETSDSGVLLYISNPNDLLTAGAHSSSNENFSNFLKPHLIRGEILMLCESTQDELNEGLGSDPGFLRLFKQIHIEPLTREESYKAIKEKIKKSDFNKIRRISKQFTVEQQNEIKIPNETDPAQRKNARRRFGKITITMDDYTVNTLLDFAVSFGSYIKLPGSACDIIEDIVDRKLSTFDIENKNNPSAYKLVNVDINADDIMESLSKRFGLPMDMIDPNKMFDIEKARNFFNERLVDQNEAVEAIVERLALLKAGLQNPNRPIGAYFLVGPTGVGKTYFSQLLAEFLFGDPKRMMRLDLSEYQTWHSIEKLIGTTSVTSGIKTNYKDILPSAIRSQPYTVLLLDEFEKGHPELYSLFLQVFDDGILTDGRGKTVSFKQTIILITSNLGAVSKSSSGSLGFGLESQDDMKSRMMNTLRKYFPPEFLNRLDGIIPFNSLSKESMKKLLDIEMKKMLTRRGFSIRKHKLVLSDEALDWLETNGFSKKYGARFLKRTLEQKLLPPIALLFIKELETSRKPTEIIISVNKSAIESESSIPLVAEWGEVLDLPEEPSTPDNEETSPDPEKATIHPFSLPSFLSSPDIDADDSPSS